jgi:heme-degrading monooxygenase HmoA
MIQILWEFLVKENAQVQFELAYGPGGAWSKLFAEAPGFRGTALLRDARNPRRYLAVDFWETSVDRERFLDDQRAAYAKLVAALAELSEAEREIGQFRVLAEATVRPRPGRAKV